ncbi:MAG: hypothetical protein AAF907_07385, partial [Planctomycetota bacterium]
QTEVPSGAPASGQKMTPDDLPGFGKPRNTLPAKFADPKTSPLTATIVEGENELEPFELE